MSSTKAHLKAVNSNENDHQIPFQDASLDIWDKKYRLKTKAGEIIDNDIDETYQRVARALADTEQEESKREEWYPKFCGHYVTAPSLPDASPLTPVLWPTNQPPLLLTVPFRAPLKTR